MEHTKGKPELSRILIGAVRAQLVVLVAGIAFLAVFCAIAYSLADPDTVTMQLSLAALYASGLAGGIAAVRFSGDGILSGWLSGVLSAILLWLLSLLPYPAAMHTFAILPSTVLFLCIPLSSLVGSVIGRKRKKTARQGPPRMRTHS